MRPRRRDGRDDLDNAPLSDLLGIRLAMSRRRRSAAPPHSIGDEGSGVTHIADGQEFTMSSAALAEAGRQLFGTRFNADEGTGRPFTNGADVALHDPSDPLLGRGSPTGSRPGLIVVHRLPQHAVTGGGGDIIGTVNVLGNRFDFVTFDQNDTMLSGLARRARVPATLQSVSDPRRRVGHVGLGYVEMLSRPDDDPAAGDRRGVRDGQPVPAVGQRRVVRRPDP